MYDDMISLTKSQVNRNTRENEKQNVSSFYLRNSK